MMSCCLFRRCFRKERGPLLLLLAASICASPWMRAAEGVALRAEPTPEYSRMATERMQLARRTLAHVEASSQQPELATELA